MQSGVDSTLHPQTKRHLRNSQKLRTAAVREFAAHGLHGTKVSSIVAAAQLTQPSFYRTWPSKEATYEEVITQTLEKQWSGPSYNPEMKVLFANAVDWCGVVKLGEVRLIKGQLFFGGAMQLDPANKAIGSTMAYDAATGKPMWRYDLQGIRIVGGVTSTAGNLVLSGAMNGTFYALDATSGKVLFKDNIDKAPIGGGVSTCDISGKQYMAVAAGNTSKGTAGVKNPGARIVIYSLP